jgi:MFS family permease
MNATPDKEQPQKPPLRRLIDFLGLKRSIVGLLGMVILVGMGTNLPDQFQPIYLLAMGGGILSLGLLGGLKNLLGALYAYPGGYLAQRIGTKRSLLVFNLMSIFGYALVILIPTWWALIIGLLFFMFWDSFSLPASMGLVAGVLPKDKRTMGVSMHSLVRRVPMAVGPFVGGVFVDKWGAQDGVRLAFVVAIVMAAIAIPFQQRFIADAKPVGGAEKNPFRLYRRMSPWLKNLLVSDILIRFCEQIPYTFVIVWAMETIMHPLNGKEFGALRIVEMATAVAVYIPIAYLADRTTKKPWVLITFGFFTLFPLVLLFSHSFEMLIIAFILRGLKEFGEPTRKALIMDFAPEDAKAGMFGLYYLIRDSIVSLAAFGGALLWLIKPEVNLLAAFGFGLVGTIWFAIRGRDLTWGTADARR